MKKTAFQKRLRAIIEDYQMSDKDFAAFLGISQITLAGYLNSNRTPTISVASTWLAKTNIDGHWLLTGEGDKYRNKYKDNINPAMVTYSDSHLPSSKVAQAAQMVIKIHSPTYYQGGIEVVSPNLQATARYFTDTKMIVCAGSVISPPQPSISKAAFEMRKIMSDAKWLLDLENEAEEVILLKDSLSLSPSAAAGLVAGTSRNGKTFWRHKKTQSSLKEILKTYPPNK